MVYWSYDNNVKHQKMFLKQKGVLFNEGFKKGNNYVK